jgi:hypothetical protein
MDPPRTKGIILRKNDSNRKQRDAIIDNVYVEAKPGGCYGMIFIVTAARKHLEKEWLGPLWFSGDWTVIRHEVHQNVPQ